ncbi:hypothetical protein [Streptomyces sp. NPDC002690]
MTNGIEEAICWSGPAVLSIFVLDPSEKPVPKSAFELDGHAPSSVGTYRLEVDPGDKRFPEVWEYDLTFESLPGHLAEVGEKLLCRGTQQDSVVAWLAFEGIFNFDRLFSDTLFAQIYGYYMAGQKPVVVDDATIRSSEWRERIRAVHDFLEEKFPAPQQGPEEGELRISGSGRRARYPS